MARCPAHQNHEGDGKEGDLEAAPDGDPEAQVHLVHKGVGRNSQEGGGFVEHDTGVDYILRCGTGCTLFFAAMITAATCSQAFPAIGRMIMP